MRVAFLNRGRDSHPGGDLVMIDALMEALGKRGVECVEMPEPAMAWDVKPFDLAHIFHCNFDWSWRNYLAVLKSGTKFVLTPLFYPDVFVGVDLLDITEIVREAKRLLPFSRIESDELNRPQNTSIIPCGTDPAFHSSYPDRRGVICVSARGSDDKNVATVAKICERLKIKFTLPANASRKDLIREYAGARVFVNASNSERMSLTIGEALCAGCRVLATQENWGNEWYPGIVTFDPRNKIQLEHLIRWALTDSKQAHWDYRPNEAARMITWDWVAEKIHQVYQEVLA